MLTIREATAADEEAVVGLWVQLVAYHRSIEEVWPRRWSGPREKWRDNLRVRLREALADPEQAVLLAEEGGEAVGFVRVGLDAEGPLPAHVHTLVVAETRRGRGIGRALMEAAERWCLERGADEVGVEFIARNEAARAAYERMGYRPFLVTYMRRLKD